MKQKISDPQAQKTKWRELIGRKDEFSKIVQLLVEFDEKTGRNLRYSDPETHFMRRAIASAASEKVRYFLKDLGGFVYAIVAELQSSGGMTATAWIHEDGIRQEREDSEASHPVHKIVCVTDLFEADARECSPEESCVSGPTLDLLTERE